jgi:hypothetical protein
VSALSEQVEGLMARMAVLEQNRPADSGRRCVLSTGPDQEA